MVTIPLSLLALCLIFFCGDGEARLVPHDDSGLVPSSLKLADMFLTHRSQSTNVHRSHTLRLSRAGYRNVKQCSASDTKAILDDLLNNCLNKTIACCNFRIGPHQVGFCQIGSCCVRLYLDQKSEYIVVAVGQPWSTIGAFAPQAGRMFGTCFPTNNSTSRCNRPCAAGSRADGKFIDCSRSGYKVPDDSIPAPPTGTCVDGSSAEFLQVSTGGQEKRSKTSKVQVIGGAVGGTALLVVLASIAMIVLLRNHRKQRSFQGESQNSSGASIEPPSPVLPTEQRQ
jgi:hypothetical protein